MTPSLNTLPAGRVN